MHFVLILTSLVFAWIGPGALARGTGGLSQSTPPRVIVKPPERQGGREFFERYLEKRRRDFPRPREARKPAGSRLDVISESLSNFFDLGGLFGSPEPSGAASPVTTGPTPISGGSGGFPGAGGNGDGSGAGGNGGGGNPGLSTDGSPAQVNQIGFNDAAPDGRDGVELRGNDNGRTGPHQNPGESTPSQAQRFPLFKPVCFLMDPVNTQGNQIIKDFVDAYAACGVVAVPFAFTIKQNYPNDPDTINALARQVCPLSSVLGVSESSIQTHVRFDTTSDLMCGSFEKPGVPTKNVAGCAEFVAPRHFSAKQEDIDAFSNSRNSGGTHFGGSGASGADAVSIVDAGQSSSVAIHEVQHNNGGVNVGEGDGRKPHGFGIESVGQNGQRTGAGDAFTGEGCEHIRGASNPNDGSHFYDPTRSTYYIPIDNPRLQYDLMAGRSFFNGGGGPPPLSPIPPARPPGELPLANAERGPEQRITGAPPSKHKKKPQPPAAVAVNRANPPSPIGESSQFFDTVGAPPSPERGEGTKSVGFNDDAEEQGAISKDFFGKDEATKRVGFNDEAEEGRQSAIDSEFFGKDGEGKGIGKDAEQGGPDAADRLLASLSDKEKEKFKSSEETKLDKNFFEEKKKKEKDEDGIDTTIPQQARGGVAANPEGFSQLSALSEDTSLFEKGASFIRSISDSIENMFDDRFFDGVKGKGQEPSSRFEERVRVIGNTQLYQE